MKFYSILLLAILSIFLLRNLDSSSQDCSSCAVVHEEVNIVQVDSDPSEEINEDEFEDFDENESADNTTINSDEFEEFSDADEFEEFEEVDEFAEFEDIDDNNIENKEEAGLDKYQKKNLFWTLVVIGFTILAGLLVRYESTRTLKMVFLLFSLAILGFYRGGCPCMISSYQGIFLLSIGQNIHWTSLLWFLSLIPLTYIFGQVWCGWVCHLGAFQEFIFKSNKMDFLKSKRSQNVMRILRWILFFVLIIQIYWTESNWFIKIDPFMVAFNLNSVYLSGWILLAILLISSLFIYRPFCRAACPVGLILGFVKKIPGAAVLGVSDECTSCVSCSKACDIQAINRENKVSIISNQDCFMCGDCMDSCKKDGISVYRKSKLHPDIVECEKVNPEKPIKIKV